MENLEFMEMKEDRMEETIDLYIDIFTREPWNDVYESRDQVKSFFKNHFKNNYFLAYLAVENGRIVAFCLGIKKPWIEGLEYYIDEIAVDHRIQGRGIGSWFMDRIEEDIAEKGMENIILNTDKGYRAYDFYIKKGFKELENLRILAK